MRAPLYGLMAELETQERLLDAARMAKDAGYARVEAYSPFPIEGLGEAVGLAANRVPLCSLCGGVLAGAGTYFMQWYSAVVSYPLNVGGRPLHSWPSFVPATFEMTVLGAALAAVFGMLFLNGLPRLRHPVFNAPDFDLAMRNRFFLCLRADDPAYRAEATRAFLQGLRPLKVVEVPL